VPGGVLIVDDFWDWDGDRLAVTEFFSERLGLDAGVAISREKIPTCFVRNQDVRMHSWDVYFETRGLRTAFD
jgi:hypothetical protein